MQRMDIRNAVGAIIGFIDQEANGDKTIRNKYGAIVGYYRKNDNTTRDANGRIIARGDACAMLLK